MPAEHNVETASRLADEPEFTISACLTPARRASARSKRCVSGPEVSQKSRLERTSSTTSSGPNTLPDTGTDGRVGSKIGLWWRSAAYSATSARICSEVGVMPPSSAGAGDS